MIKKNSIDFILLILVVLIIIIGVAIYFINRKEKFFLYAGLIGLEEEAAAVARRAAAPARRATGGTAEAARRVEAGAGGPTYSRVNKNPGPPRVTRTNKPPTVTRTNKPPPPVDRSGKIKAPQGNQLSPAAIPRNVPESEFSYLEPDGASSHNIYSKPEPLPPGDPITVDGSNGIYASARGVPNPTVVYKTPAEMQRVVWGDDPQPGPYVVYKTSAEMEAGALARK
jgi:hypothetical protein